ncbi:N-acetyltransferase [Elioraea tepidiphila]|jgi:GNAT superfamily N-acetyltransferase|uniref:GNAT family N-acetyltransferase n=1 Tax=Elioraea tepidiphila TaxID=457934 RepID=UPI00035C6D60|nr:GNAT family N-acetyltransferase [Elioraea tepidiphila]
MTLAAGFHDVPAGHVPTVVTHLEMTTMPLLRPAPPPPPSPRGPWTIARAERIDLAWYRALYRRIGTDWLWSARLLMADGALAALLNHPDFELWTLRQEAVDEGIAELDFREPGHCELRLFGVTAGLIGTGAARTLMNHAIARAWARPGLRRFWLHTCTLDHPRALAFYIRSGFVPFRYQVEIMPDPRLDGTLPADAAPGVPIIRPAR